MLGPGWGLLALLVVLAVFLWSRRKRLRARRTWLELVAIAYVGVLLSLTLLPFPLPPYETQPGCPFVYIVPLGTIWPAIHTRTHSL